MRRENRTKYAVLGLLAVGEQSGYDLKKNFQRRMAHFWAESAGQIYPTLARLADEGLVTSSVQPQRGRPDRNVHAITPEGRRVLRDWLIEPPAPDQLRMETLLKLFFGPELGPEAALRHVERYEQTQAENLALYETFEDEIRRVAETPEQEFYWQLSLQSGLRVTSARLAWCREAKRAIRQRMEQQPVGPVARDST